MTEKGFENAVVLVTGAARRIGAAIVTRLHETGARVAIHYRGSADEAAALADKLNERRAASAKTFQADLRDNDAIQRLVDVVERHGEGGQGPRCSRGHLLPV